MKLFKNLKLKSRLVLSFTGVLVVFSGVITGATYLNTYSLGDTVYQENITSVQNLSKTLIDSKFKGDWSIKNDKLYKGNVDVSQENELLDSLKEQSGYYTTIFQGDTRIATNVIGTDGKRAVGTTAAPNVVEEVISKGNSYSGEAEVVGIDTYVKYDPIKDANGEVIGMFFTGVPKSTVQAKVTDSVKVVVGIVAVSLIIGSAIAYAIGNAIVKKVKEVSNQLDKMAKNDFTGEIDKKVLESVDELGDMARAAQTMTDAVSTVIKSIHTESEKINGLMQKTTSEISALKVQASEVSSATQNVAATTEETASSMLSIAEATKNVDSYVSEMTKSADDGAKKANLINERALMLKDSANKSQQLAIEIIDDSKVKINEAVKRAANIREIELLSSTIAQIASKTTLLSLNASIEASRAGEAGLGFSVVANEIKELAEESQEAVSRIQETTKDVLASVQDLITSTNGVLDFVDKNVLEDYKKLVETGEQYHSDAKFVQNFTNDLSINANQISADIAQVNHSIDGITSATNDSARVVEGIAYNSDLVTEKSLNVEGMAEETQASVQELQRTVSAFKVK